MVPRKTDSELISRNFLMKATIDEHAREGEREREEDGEEEKEETNLRQSETIGN